MTQQHFTNSFHHHHHLHHHPCFQLRTNDTWVHQHGAAKDGISHGKTKRTKILERLPTRRTFVFILAPSTLHFCRRQPTLGLRYCRVFSPRLLFGTSSCRLPHCGRARRVFSYLPRSIRYPFFFGVCLSWVWRFYLSGTRRTWMDMVWMIQRIDGFDSEEKSHGSERAVITMYN